LINAASSPGITDANGDGIPDITYVVKEGNTLEPNPNNGIGLTISIRNMDQLVLFTNGYK
jgi:anti-sigma regulatory factor (Ser/Thr protein kinase)